MYMRNVRLDQRPIFMMVVLLALCSIRDMPSPAMIEWVLTRSGLVTEW